MCFFDRQGIPEALVRNRSVTGNSHRSVEAINPDVENIDSDNSESEASVDNRFENYIFYTK
jgi:hypothetical protein